MIGNNPPVIEFYTRPGCPFSKMLRFRLHRAGLTLSEVDIWEHPDAAARVRSVAGGNETVPTVFIGEVSLVNPKPRQVLAALRTAAAPQ